MNDCGEKEEIVRRTIVRRFDIAVGRCRDCQRRVQGRHRFQTSDAVGVGRVQLGPEALTLAAILNKQMGLSLGHTRQVLSYGFGLEVSRGGLYRALARMAGRAEPTYHGLVESARQAPVNGMDETGWKVGGRLQWLHVAVSAQVTVYAILPGRGYEQAARILGVEYDGFLIHDGWAPYYRFQFACHQSCLAHLLKRCREMAQVASPAALAFPRAVEHLLQTSLELRDRYEQGEVSERGMTIATGKLEAQLDRMLATRRRNPANRRLARHLEHEQLWLFTFLHCFGLDATNNAAERAIRGMVIARKVWGGNRTWGRRAHATNPDQRAAHLLAAGQGCLHTMRETVACATDRNPGHCVRRGLNRAIFDCMPESFTFCGRMFRAGELELMRQTAREFSALGVTEIARTVCELLEWKRPGGGLKNHECRQLLERLQAEGFLKLPEVRKLGGRGPRRADVSGSCSEPALVECSAREGEPMELVLVEGQAESRRWREQMERYHYLGCRVPFGAHLRYWVRHRERELACLLWTSPAWKMQARDEWIGWSDEQRRHNLQSIVNNGRFLILPWVQVKGLASKILALSARQMPRDWEIRYGCRPLLLETLVDTARFRGTCYRAANWIHVGQTAGRGRMDREHTAHGQVVKDIYVYPLARDARQQLCRD